MDNMSKFGMAAGAGGLGAGLGSLLFGGGKNPYDAASGYFDQIPGAMSQYYQPYIDAGHNSMNQLQNQYGGLVNDPNAMYNKIASGYQHSPGYDWQVGQGTNAVNNAAAAGGMIGSPQHQQQSAQMTQGIANQDFNNYFGHVMGMYGEGLNGLKDINHMGYGASNEYANTIGNSLMNQGNLAFSGQASENQAKGSQWGDIFGGLGTIASFL